MRRCHGGNYTESRGRMLENVGNQEEMVKISTNIDCKHYIMHCIYYIFHPTPFLGSGIFNNVHNDISFSILDFSLFFRKDHFGTWRKM